MSKMSRYYVNKQNINVKMTCMYNSNDEKFQGIGI